ncbi:family 16 glycosylhydrolase [Undibacterium sp.]|uniref:glycoside hydrolase family 16 protein n=1 Tax=Undibacterium sp. TaxID=1914977 RepID=UPI00375117D9
MKFGLATLLLYAALAGCGGGAGVAPSATQSTPVPAASVQPNPTAPSDISITSTAAVSVATTTVAASTAILGGTLVWADEFNVDGLPDSTKWAYDTARNSAGWYNNELQYYSNARLQNSAVSNGALAIIAKKEKLSSASDYGNQNYTSARLITQGKFSFTYGFVEVRAKLPCGIGTWPAIWTLGTDPVGWPANGEIDIMEQKGFSAVDKSIVLGALHMPAFHGGNPKSNSISVSDACTAFHKYQLTWTADKIQIGVDDVIYHVYDNPKTGDRTKWPFDKPQYLLLNVAMGGDLGGPVPSTFSSDQMEIDYVRVYQK